ncbi:MULTISPECIES: Rieske (2Fe-2S) protein [Streptomyces]|uniref:Cytochrome bc1 complex Rieske iron-sulfur subunit n=2 Tax=Streptomyces TaxID=1883 RepID=A0ABW6Z109_9ACTN|nr:MULTISPECIES: Rieske (2Fe-2S) protein [Streptomyces]MCL3996966.1 Rieske (2Fe-2S) protein [Streptomyces lavenduligriseus]QIS70294.1 Rieske (2Fe-2S) protein [Streptomyces sp. DSM 40868]WDM16301.1 Rieske (2Fe-2S) protein [Streptomyces lavenduligriseus]
MPQPATRRTVLATGAGALALGCVGCGADSGAATAPQPPTAPASPPSPAAEGGAGETSPAAREAAPAGRPLARTEDIPEGGGKVFEDRKIVVTQPEKGRFKAFSAVCTHQGCTVSQVTDGTILCPCHSSRFRIADGSVAAGPASRPLAEEPVTVRGNSVYLT